MNAVAGPDSAAQCCVCVYETVTCFGLFMLHVTVVLGQEWCLFNISPSVWFALNPLLVTNYSK